MDQLLRMTNERILNENVMPDNYDLIWENRGVRQLLAHLPVGFLLAGVPLKKGNDPLLFRIIDINPVFLRIFRLQKEDYINRTIDEVFPEFSPLLRSIAQKCLISAEPVTVRRHIKAIERNIQTVAFRPQKNRIIFLIADRTEEILTRCENKKLQGQLMHSQKMEDIGTLAGGIAHDFNNLITAIHGYAEVALLQADNRAYQEECLKQILLTAQRAANLTQQLLFFSRKKPIEKKSDNLSKIIRELVNMLKRIIGENISVKLKLDEHIPQVALDRGQIEQVITNLAVNASDAMQEGGLLTVKTTAVDIDEEYCKSYKYAKPGKFVCMIFEDTGTGMDPETTQKLSEPFFTTKKGGKGTGLGLSLVYSIVKDHGGWINVYSEQGKGSSFKIYLPVCSLEKEPEDERIRTRETILGKGERVLFVEDDSDIYRLVKTQLSKSGYTVFTAKTVKEAAEIFKKQKDNIDILITDVVLPDSSGIELARSLLLEKPDLKVLLTSGYLDREGDWELIDDKSYRFIQKPYSLTDLLRSVGETVNGTE